MKTWQFGIDNDILIELVLSGKKTATTSIYDENDLPIINEEKILIFNNEKKACITKTIDFKIMKFKDMTEDCARLEGEGDLSLDYWKKVHHDFFKKQNNDFNEDSLIVFEIFKVTKNLVEERLALAKTIVNNNLDIFKNIQSIEEINAGFNNHIFNINNKYIIKICADETKENLFDIEANFYNKNKDNENIPKLYKYDKSKTIVPYVYEIIEKVNGKSVYYYWYKMNENERENFIKRLVDILKQIHKNEYKSYDWSNHIKERILSSYNKTKYKFNEEEKNIILTSLNNYDEILIDNRFSLIHNDLHFDNILLDNKNNIKLIDFNDSIIAPFDYDLRIFYMCVTLPWKWANIEMDPYQLPKDYINLFNYIKKYYTELNDIKYLNERMIIYFILNDFELFPEYTNNELKTRILENSKKILEFKKY